MSGQKNLNSFYNLLKPLAFGLGVFASVNLTAIQSSEATTLSTQEVFNTNIDGLFLSGRYASQVHDYNLAALLFEAAVQRQLDAGGSIDILMLAEARDAYLRAGEVEKAIVTTETIQEVAGREYNDFYGTMLISIGLIKDEKWDDALEKVKRIPSGRLASVLKPMMKGWIEAGKGNKERAIAAISPAKDRVEGLHSYVKGQILTYMGDPEEALNAYLLPESYQDPMQLPNLTFRGYIRALLALDRGEEARKLTAQYVLQSGGGGTVQNDLAAIMKGEALAPLTSGPKEGVGEVLYQTAQFLGASGRPIFLDINRMGEFLHPNHLNLKLSVAEFMQNVDQLSVAADLFEDVVQQFPHYWQAGIFKAEILWELEEKDAAADILNDLAAERPGDLLALYNLARLHNRDQDFPQMGAVMDRLISRIKDPLPSDWLYYYFRGIAFERMKEWPKAEADFLKALELNPDEPDVLNYLGYSWVDQGMHLERAQEMLRKAVEARRGSGAIADSLGWVYYKLGKYDQAVDLLERAVTLEPNEAVIVEHLGDAYWQVGRKREARFQWNRALKWSSDEVDVEKLQQKLEVGL